MLTIDELLALRGRVWAEKPPTDCSLTDQLLWRTASELASFLEMHEAADFRELAPESLAAIEAAETYFAVKGLLVPQSVALALLRLRRHDAGLTER